ncbi:MAG: cobalamin-dependent protein [Chloroflexi bacterium]|nr:cobalamin-dependent protein [Chloroflexota bacterium]
MKVLLVATNQAERYMSRMVVRPLPIGLAYLAASIDEEKHQLQVLDLMFSDDALADVDAAVKCFQPDVVGLSIRNLDNQSYLDSEWHLPADLQGSLVITAGLVGPAQERRRATQVAGYAGVMNISSHSHPGAGETAQQQAGRFPVPHQHGGLQQRNIAFSPGRILI